MFIKHQNWYDDYIVCYNIYTIHTRYEPQDSSRIGRLSFRDGPGRERGRFRSKERVGAPRQRKGRSTLKGETGVSRAPPKEPNSLPPSPVTAAPCHGLKNDHTITVFQKAIRRPSLNSQKYVSKKRPRLTYAWGYYVNSILDAHIQACMHTVEVGLECGSNGDTGDNVDGFDIIFSTFALLLHAKDDPTRIATRTSSHAADELYACDRG